MIKDKKVDEASEIKEIVLMNENGTKEIIEKGMITHFKRNENDEVNMTLRFCNLDMTEINTILRGLQMMIND